MIITCKRTEKGWATSAYENGKMIISLNLEVSGEYVVVHNVINLWTPRTARLYKQAFDLIKKGATDAGYKYIATGCFLRNYDKKKEKFWHLMGLNIFGEIEWKGSLIKAAGVRLQ